MKLVIGSGARVRACPREIPVPRPARLLGATFSNLKNLKSNKKKKNVILFSLSTSKNKICIFVVARAALTSPSSSFLLICVLFNQGVIDSVSAADTSTGGVKTSMTGASHTHGIISLTDPANALEKI